MDVSWRSLDKVDSNGQHDVSSTLYGRRKKDYFFSGLMVEENPKLKKYDF